MFGLTDMHLNPGFKNNNRLQLLSKIKKQIASSKYVETETELIPFNVIRIITTIDILYNLGNYMSIR